MALTSSVMAQLGAPAPDFRLPDAAGRTVALADFAEAPALLVVFWCNHCPYVRHIRSAFAEFAREYGAQGLAIVAINSNDWRAFPEDDAAHMRTEIDELGYTFDYLIDESQTVARAYHAACTPDFFLYDRDRRLVYRGQFDSSRPGKDEPVTGRDLRAAVDAVLAGTTVAGEQVPSIGCNIKWKSGP